MKTKSELYGDIERSAEQEMTDHNWESEFRGFFWGEGTLGFLPNHPLRRLKDGTEFKQKFPCFTIHSSIGLRWDDRFVLYQFQKLLGGVIRKERYRKDEQKFIARWQVSDTDANLRIARILGEGTSLPFNKKRQLTAWTKALLLKKGAEGRVKRGLKGSMYTEREREELLELANEISRFKQYEPNWLTE